MSTGTRSDYIAIIFLIATASMGCKYKSELYCESSSDCMHGSGVCDVQGICAASDYITNTCIPEACWDAGAVDTDGSTIDATLGDSGIPSDAHLVDACVPAQCGAATCGTMSTGCGDEINCFAGCALSLVETFLSGDTQASFGESVALQGDRLVIGAPSFGTQNIGSAWVYEFNGTQWLSFELDRGPVFSNERFGSSVALDGDIAVVGAPAASGRAFVFSRGTLNWLGEELAPSDAPLDSYFGFAVAVSGTRLVVGAPQANAVYVYEHDGLGWNETKVQPSNAGSTDRFGHAVALDGDLMLVGAPERNIVGSAYLFTKNGTQWSELELPPPVTAGVSGYGRAVSIHSGTVVVAAPYTNSRVGAVYVFAESSPGTWSAAAPITPSDGQNDDSFGSSVSMSDGLLSVGSMFAQSSAGRAYWFAPTNAGLVEHIQAAPAGAEAYGAAISIDRTGLLVGSPAEVGEGRVRLYRFLTP